ncbi:MAE_28990/MAE_18760 family HEPN-like nuclease [Pseudomonas sp. P105]|uniref:MAE_28990/MAE_18760 family HEPN-like nuclease n=1 Tax=Pseudomonas sp. P105 TaxID=3049542 RepID=UPI0039773A4D
MLEAVKDEFNKRSEEIDTLYSHIIELDGETNERLRESSVGLISILASSLCLMLYNQVESTAFSCVESIYDSVHERRISFNRLVPGFKKKILNDCKQSYHSVESLMLSFHNNDISEVIARTSLKLEKVFSGNVDARKLREVLGYYHLAVSGPSPLNQGAELLNLKIARNSLAHGSASFEKYGRSLTVSDLDDLRNNIREYMSHVISLTECYLEAEAYLDPSNAA